MNPIVTQQVALDNALIAPEKRLKIERCNARIKFSKPQRETTYQVTLEVLKLSPCYPAFLITAEVPQIYMHQFWNTIKKIKDTDDYNFKLPDQDFVIPPSEDEIIPFIQELGYSGKCEMLFAIHTDQMHQPWRTFAAIINRFISRKTTRLDRLRESRAQILWDMFNQKNVDYVALLINLHTVRDDTLLGTLKFVSKTKDSQKYGALIPDWMINQDIKDSEAYKTYYDFTSGKVAPKKAIKIPAKKTATVPTTGVVIRDTSGVSVSKKKAPAEVAKDKGIDLLLDVALLKAAQLKKSLKESKQETHKVQDSGSIEGVGSQIKVPDEHEDTIAGTDEGTGTRPGVPDVPKYNSESESESWGDSQDDESDDGDSDNENDGDNKDDDIKNDNDGNSDVDDSEKTDSDDDENPKLNLKDDEEEEKEEEYVYTPEYGFSDDEEYEDLYGDVNVNLKDAEHEEEKGDGEMTNVGRENVSQEKVYEQVVDDAHVTITKKTDSSKQSSSIKDHNEEPSSQTSSLLTISTPLTAATTTVPLSILSVSSLPQQLLHQKLNRLLPLYLLFQISRPCLDSTKGFLHREEKDKDEDPPTRSNQGLKKRKTGKDAELPKGSKSKESMSSSSKGTKKTINFRPPQTWISRIAKAIKPPLTFDEPMNTPIDFSALKGTCKSRVELEFHFKECYKAVTDRLDWKNPEGHQYLFDLSKPLPLIEVQGRQVVPANYFINNDLGYLKGGSLSRKYTTSTTKTKAAKYDNIEGIKDMVPTLWNLVKVAYDRYALWGISHWGQKRQKFYRFWYDYGYLEEIEVRREDETLYKFKEVDFPNLNLRDIDDMLLVLVQKKILNLTRDVIFNLNVALRIFTRRVVIQKGVEDLQLIVESYQKKLNITRPETFKSEISDKTPYTAYTNPRGIIYLDKFNRNRFMHSDKLYKSVTRRSHMSELLFMILLST
ncbi:hypothetical protein Tco_1304166 [Tanacetum coccineum]